MLTKTLSEAKKKQRNILIKAMNNDIGSIDSAKDSWNPAQISERAKDISYIRSLVDSWNPAQLNEALKMLDLPVIDTWNPAQIEEQRRNLVFYLAERTLTGNPITLKILGNLTPEVTGLKVTMNPIQDLHGYDNPWVGGAGKNKLCLTIRSASEVSGVTSEVKADNNIVASGNAGANADIICYLDTPTTLTSGNTYTFSLTGTDTRGGAIYLFVGTPDVNVGAINVNIHSLSFTPSADIYMDKIRLRMNSGSVNINAKAMLESGSTAHDYEPYENICPISGRTEASVTRTAGEDVETKTHQYSETIYGGTDDFVNGGLTNEWGYIASYAGETLPGEWISDRDVYAPGTTPTTGAEVCYKLATPTTISTSAEEITLLKGTNVLSTDGDSIELKYKQNF